MHITWTSRGRGTPSRPRETTSRGRGAARRTALVAALGAVLIAPAVAFAPAAGAATDGSDVYSVTTSSTGSLVVQLDTANVLWVQVTVRADATPDAADLLTTDDLEGSGAYRYIDDVRLPAGTAYGTYPVDVDYRLTTGTVQHWSGADHASVSRLEYRTRTTVVSAVDDRRTVDYDHPDVTVRGAVTVFDPATGDTTPAVGVTVGGVWNDYPGSGTEHSTPTTTTDADGNYALTFTPVKGIGYGTVSVLDPTTGAPVDGVAPMQEAEVVPTYTRTLGGPSVLRVHAGTTVTISGTAQRATADGWQAFDGMPVATHVADTFGRPTATIAAHGTTDAAGHYSYTLVATRTATYLTEVPATAYLEPSDYQPSRVWVPTAATYTLAASLDQYATATATGRVTGNCADQRLYLQYSANNSTGWTTIGSALTAVSTSTSCTYRVTAPGHAAGYYRVTHPETNQLLAATTHSIRLARTPTRIDGVHYSSSRPAVNSTLTVTGRLAQLHGTAWIGVNHAIVALAWKPRGETQYYLMKRVYTSSTGRFSLPSKVYGDGYWGVFYSADSTHLYSETPVTYVDAR